MSQIPHNPKSDGERVEPDFSKGEGLVPVIAQCHETGAVLMLAYMDADAYAETLETGEAVYYSRSRQGRWKKGDTSGHIQRVKQVLIDCDRDTVLLKVEQVGGAACHAGYTSCFYRDITSNEVEIVADRVFDPNVVYRDKSNH